MFVNSEYRGAYLLVEKVNIDGDRVAVDKDTGVILETDGKGKPDPRYGFTTPHGINIVLKDPDTYKYNSDGSLNSEGIYPSRLSAARNQVSRVESALYAADKSNYTSYIHRASAVDFYLLKEFFKDVDSHFWRSDFFTWDSTRDCGTLCDGLVHFGPVWDFDRSVGNIDPETSARAYVRSAHGWYMNGTGVPYDSSRTTYKTQWFAQLWKISSFRSAIRTRWDEVRPAFIASYQTEVTLNKALIGVGASNDRARWAGEPKVYGAKGPTYSHETQYVASWLRNRYAWMNGQLD